MNQSAIDADVGQKLLLATQPLGYTTVLEYVDLNASPQRFHSCQSIRSHKVPEWSPPFQNYRLPEGQIVELRRFDASLVNGIMVE